MSGTTTITLSGTPAPGYIGVAYNFAPQAAGGDHTKYAFTATGLPKGLAIDAKTGVISGTTTVVGAAAVTVNVTDGTNNGSQAFTLPINPAVSMSGTPVDAKVGQSYQFSPTIQNAVDGGTIQVTLAAGTIPAGLSLNASTGTISGTPTASGTASFTLSITDGTTTGSQAYSFKIVSPLRIIPVVDPVVLDKPYNFVVGTSGGDGTALTWSIEDGALPEGLTLNSATGAISGTALESGDFPFTITAVSVDGEEDSEIIDMQVTDQGFAETEGKSAAQVRFENAFDVYVTTLTGVADPSVSQLLTASQAIDEATITLQRDCTPEILDSALATVKANPDLFSPINLDRGMSLLTPAHARVIHTLWGQFYNVVTTPQTPIAFMPIIRDTRRVNIANYLRKAREAALAA